MSRLARKPVALTEGVSVERNSHTTLLVKGPRGEILVPILPLLEVILLSGEVIVKPLRETRKARANAGTMRALIRNAVQGVREEFTKILEIEGIGYRASMEGNTLVLSLGYSHPLRVDPPSGVTIRAEKNLIVVSGVSKELVGRVASHIHSLKKPEPYKGKGIRYQGEVIRRKTGKKAVAVGAK